MTKLPDLINEDQAATKMCPLLANFQTEPSCRGNDCMWWGVCRATPLVAALAKELKSEVERKP